MTGKYSSVMKFVNNAPVAALVYSGKSGQDSHFLFGSDKSITSECVPFINGNPVVTKSLSIKVVRIREKC